MPVYRKNNGTLLKTANGLAGSPFCCCTSSGLLITCCPSRVIPINTLPEKVSITLSGSQITEQRNLTHPEFFNFVSIQNQSPVTFMGFGTRLELAYGLQFNPLQHGAALYPFGDIVTSGFTLINGEYIPVTFTNPAYIYGGFKCGIVDIGTFSSPNIITYYSIHVYISRFLGPTFGHIGYYNVGNFTYLNSSETVTEGGVFSCKPLHGKVSTRHKSLRLFTLGSGEVIETKAEYNFAIEFNE